MARTKASTSQRGYGYQHQQARKAWAPVVATGTCRCTRWQDAQCPGLIKPNDAWELDHNEDRTGYLGPAHARCNRRAGAIKGNRRRKPRPNVSRRW